LILSFRQVGVQQFYKRRPIAGVESYTWAPSNAAAAATDAGDVNDAKDDDARRYHGNAVPPAAESAHRLQPAHHQYVSPSVRRSVRPSVCLSQPTAVGKVGSLSKVKLVEI